MRRMSPRSRGMVTLPRNRLRNAHTVIGMIPALKTRLGRWHLRCRGRSGKAPSQP
ncbi:MAG: hypothetical protein J6X49_11400 [Victivallales bacterium]|nr:hypothetical protein [Victivallales bacterium]